MKLFNYFDKAYCISLPEREARRARARGQFQKMGIEAEFVDGVRCDDPLGFRNKGERGAFLAHLKTLEKGADENQGPFLIFEDDLLAPRSMHGLDLAPELSRGDWSFFFLGYGLMRETEIMPIPGTSFQQAKDDFVYMAHAYSIRRDLVPLVIRELREMHDKNPVPLDAAYNLIRQKHGLKPTLIGGKPIIQCAGTSDVQDSTQSSKLRRSLSLLKFRVLDLIY